VSRVVVVVVGVVVVAAGAVVVVTGATARTGVALVVVVTVTEVGSPTSVVEMVGSGPRYGCGTGSEVRSGALDVRGPKPMAAANTRRIPSAANTYTYQGGRLPGS
jgi:hypothetical protein